MNALRHVVVRGRVQGVGFRAWAEHAALGRGLEGWVRNRRDGAIEAVFAGPSVAVAEMTAACGRGPPEARVDTIEEREGTAADLGPRRPGERFSVLATV